MPPTVAGPIMTYQIMSTKISFFTLLYKATKIDEFEFKSPPYCLPGHMQSIALCLTQVLLQQ
jgi:hypothetical protein